MTHPDHDGAQPAEASEEHIHQLRATAHDARARLDKLSEAYADGQIDYQQYIDLSAQNLDLLTQVEAHLRGGPARTGLPRHEQTASDDEPTRTTADDPPEHVWLDHVLRCARDANKRSNRLARWMPTLTSLALLAFISLCTAMIVATRDRNDALMIAGLVADIPLTAAVLITIGCAIGQARTTHRWIDSLDPRHARKPTPNDNPAAGT